MPQPYAYRSASFYSDMAQTLLIEAVPINSHLLTSEASRWGQPNSAKTLEYKPTPHTDL